MIPFNKCGKEGKPYGDQNTNWNLKTNHPLKNNILKKKTAITLQNLRITE